jgi:hypothetical protein
MFIFLALAYLRMWQRAAGVQATREMYLPHPCLNRILRLIVACDGQAQMCETHFTNWDRARHRFDSIRTARDVSPTLAEIGSQR